MKKTILLSAITAISLTIQSAFAQVLWTNTQGAYTAPVATTSNVDKQEEVRDMLCNSNGIYTCGSRLNGGTSGDQNDFEVIRHDASTGNALNFAVYDYHNLDDYAKKMAADASGNIYLAGVGRDVATGTMNMVLLKYSSTCVFQWMQEFNYSIGGQNGEEDVIDLQVAPNGYIYVLGNTKTSSYKNDIYLRRYNSSGTLVSSVLFNNGALAYNETAADMDIDIQNNVYVAGSRDTITGTDALMIKFSGSLSLMWRTIYSYNSLVEKYNSVAVTNTGYVFAGGYRTPTSGNTDFLLTRFSTTTAAAFTSATALNSAYNDEVKKIGVNGSDVYFSGHTRNASAILKVITAKCNISFTIQTGWPQTFNTANSNEYALGDMKVNGVGDVGITGTAYSYSSIGIPIKQLFAVSYSTDGAIVQNYEHPFNTNCGVLSWGNTITFTDNYVCAIVAAGGDKLFSSAFEYSTTWLVIDFYCLLRGTNESTINVENNLQMKIFPNPVQTELNIISPVNNLTVKIYSVTGKLVDERILNEGNNLLNIESLAPGVYCVIAGDSKNKFSEKFVKQ